MCARLIVEQTGNINGKMLSLSTVAIFACVVNYTYATTVSSGEYIFYSITNCHNLTAISRSRDNRSGLLPDAARQI